MLDKLKGRRLESPVHGASRGEGPAGWGTPDGGPRQACGPRGIPACLGRVRCPAGVGAAVRNAPTRCRARDCCASRARSDGALRGGNVARSAPCLQRGDRAQSDSGTHARLPLLRPAALGARQLVDGGAERALVLVAAGLLWGSAPVGILPSAVAAALGVTVLERRRGRDPGANGLQVGARGA
jgi:hypothetical protein